MGTNFYRVNIPTEEDIKKLHKLVDEGKLLSRRGYWGEEDSESVQDIRDDCTMRIHICKRSCGWQICFDHNWGKYYQPTRTSLNEFLSQPNTRIEDEYGDTYTLDQFWKEMDEHNASPHSRWVSKTYTEWERARNPSCYEGVCREDIRKCRELFGVEPEMNDLLSEGLRFAVFSDFC